MLIVVNWFGGLDNRKSEVQHLEIGFYF